MKAIGIHFSPHHKLSIPHLCHLAYLNRRRLNITMLAAASVAALGFTATTPAAAMSRSCVRTESAVMLEQPSTRYAPADSYRVPCRRVSSL